MKNSLLLSMLLCSLYSMGQISTQSNTDGSITITPRGLQGKTNPSADTTNVALGGSALQNISTTGLKKYNTAIGNMALYSNIGGIDNTAIGSQTLSSNTTGTGNTSIGSQALTANTIGTGNTAAGYFALYNNIDGSGNTALGSSSLNSNISGSFNTAIGIQTLFSNTTGESNTAVGDQALYKNKSGNFNSAHGYGTLNLNTTGEYNSALGYFALQGNTTGINNTGIGRSALFANSTGNYNTAIGYRTGWNNYYGSYNTFVGHYANTSSGNLTHATAIGAYAIVDASYKVRIGSDSVTVIEGQVPFTSVSDRRKKENILYTNHLGLGFINKLQTVSYSFISDKTKTRHDGFIAQDIEAVMKELNVPFSGLKKSDDGMYSLAYSDFVMPLVNAAKELKQQNDEQQSEINDLKKQLAALAQRMTKMETAKTEAKMNDSEAAKR